ncbi:hypothetical protein PHYBLDRAFT_167210 [Phycomyces blakesleeanus NRRL 1555(-)]|uniref:Uncharacterized protein n=1 Tax=Phycomyces blakesleeanus (strain ATCC 8743b / DSM 1359 / FGSC 10004 / NBRC 33097 / NRRL 1555) TaxID=763407 RepID=A0A167N3B5_PHYB8|nr:hypothetical protein PHYBLDRAFT_167210 [Phycomyces blakesleeanus NRRL 1555(-)]OAD74870.1 hypothetical protein PHYBLDRAFT_167210 [Phycomyces blakesleeanus NRRL 1555(-)]|eukprot:XP_018292910.1 hypothetical protein PHYBLDRAFT_167210 [Phycomyces blakesleeanus NRRL 1555(-)]
MIYLMKYQIMAPRTNINQNAHTNRSASRPLINTVNTGCIGSSNPMIAPTPDNMSIPVSEFNDVVSILATLNNKMTAVSSDVSELKVQCQVGAQSTGMQAVLDSDMDPQDIISSSRHPKISLIRENNDKPTWDVNVGLSDEFNKNLATAMVPPKELCGIIVNSYYNCLAASKLTEEDIQTNTTSNRRGNRKTALNKRRKRTYKKHKDAVTKKFNRDYNGVFYRDAMSGDETETDTSVVASRSDWRSNELNAVFDFLDNLARDDLGKRAT